MNGRIREELFEESVQMEAGHGEGCEKEVGHHLGKNLEGIHQQEGLNQHVFVRLEALALVFDGDIAEHQIKRLANQALGRAWTFPMDALTLGALKTKCQNFLTNGKGIELQVQG